MANLGRKGPPDLKALRGHRVSRVPLARRDRRARKGRPGPLGRPDRLDPQANLPRPREGGD
jgi:hypothetical protein